MRLCGLCWPEVKGKRVVVVTGSFEQHGPHLPLSTDTLIAEAVADKVAEELGAVLGPTLWVGVSPEHMGFPGTITLSANTFKAGVKEVVESIRRHGFDDIIIVNGHGGNNRVLSELNVDVKIVNLTEKLKPYDHAGEVETSLMMYLHPKLVKKGEIKPQKFRWPGKKEWEDTREYSESGVLGYPEKASKEKGAKYFKELVEKTLAELR